MQCKYLRALPLHESQTEVKQTADYSVFTYLLRPTYDFVQEVLSRGEDVEVLTPEWLREGIRKKVKAIAAHYEEGGER